MKELTRAEEQIMQILWKLEKGFVNDILENFPEPKPAYNTVSTIIRILEKKGFAGHLSFGKTHQYYPLVSKEEYARVNLGGLLENYFSNSYKQLVSFFTQNERLSVRDLEELKKIMEQEIAKQKKR